MICGFTLRGKQSAEFLRDLLQLRYGHAHHLAFIDQRYVVVAISQLYHFIRKSVHKDLRFQIRLHILSDTFDLDRKRDRHFDVVNFCAEFQSNRDIVALYKILDRLDKLFQKVSSET